MAKIQKVPTGEFHSGYGCIIMTAVIGIFAFIIWWSYYTLTTMDKAIDALCQPVPAKLPDIPPVPNLPQRLTDFATAANAGKPATMKLSVADLNALLVLAPDTGSGSYKDMVRIKALDPAKQTIITDVNFTLHKKLWEEGKRYLVGEADYILKMTEVGPDAEPIAIRVPGKTVPEEMVKGMAMYGFMGPYQKDPKLGVILTEIKSVKVEADGLVVSTEKK